MHLQEEEEERGGGACSEPKLARGCAALLTHTDGHKFRIGADGHHMLGDPLTVAGTHLRLGQIDDTQVAHVAQLVHA